LRTIQALWRNALLVFLLALLMGLVVLTLLRSLSLAPVECVVSDKKHRVEYVYDDRTGFCFAIVSGNPYVSAGKQVGVAEVQCTERMVDLSDEMEGRDGGTIIKR
jgi:hypothetical protein